LAGVIRHYSAAVSCARASTARVASLLITTPPLLDPPVAVLPANDPFCFPRFTRSSAIHDRKQKLTALLHTKAPTNLVDGPGTGAKPDGLAEGRGDVATLTASRLPVFDRTGTRIGFLCGRIVEIKPMKLIRFDHFSFEPTTQWFYEANQGRN
jgi:hypothetical protein